MSAAAADYNNEGHTDLFVAGLYRNVLYRNLGNGKFEDVTEKAGIKSDKWSVELAGSITGYRTPAGQFLGRLATERPDLFAHWQLGMTGTFVRWEPSEMRISRSVLREAGGEIPPAYSPNNRTESSTRTAHAIRQPNIFDAQLPVVRITSRLQPQRLRLPPAAVCRKPC